MEMLIVISKVKKYIKETAGMSTSSSFFSPLNEDIYKSLDQALTHVEKSARKTVMGKDFNLYVDSPKLNEILVVASKVKKHIKEKNGYSISSQCMEQLTVRVQKICIKAIENAQCAKRKTVMDKDFESPTLLSV